VTRERQVLGNSNIGRATNLRLRGGQERVVEEVRSASAPQLTPAWKLRLGHPLPALRPPLRARPRRLDAGVALHASRLAWPFALAPSYASRSRSWVVWPRAESPLRSNVGDCVCSDWSTHLEENITGGDPHVGSDSRRNQPERDPLRFNSSFRLLSSRTTCRSLRSLHPLPRHPA
jgi:hypothetical protein